MTWNLAGSSPVPYKVNQVGGVTRRAVVVEHSTNPLECKLPAAANAAEIAGVARETATDGATVAVQQSGEVELVIASAVGVGDRLNVADAQGRVKVASEAAATIVFGVGTALTAGAVLGDIITARVQLDRSTN